jgi:hypothetical protein
MHQVRVWVPFKVEPLHFLIGRKFTALGLARSFFGQSGLSTRPKDGKRRPFSSFSPTTPRQIINPLIYGGGQGVGNQCLFGAEMHRLGGCLVTKAHQKKDINLTPRSRAAASRHVTYSHLFPSFASISRTET